MTAPAEAQGRKYETQVIRFTDQGILLNVPPEIVPTGAFVVLNDVVANRDGTVQSAAGSVVLFTAANTHSIRRFENHTTGATFYIVGVGTELYSYPIGGGAGTLITTGFSGNPLTQVNYRIAILSNPYQYIGDVNKNVKVDSAGVATKVGIIRPIPLYAQIGIVPVASGAGNLVGDYDWRYTFARLVGSVVVAESNPSDLGTTITLASEQADVTVVASNAAQGDITNIRLWRRGGTLPDAWRLVTTLANANATYTDNTADIDLASAEIMQFDNDVIGTSVDSSGVTLADNLAVPLPYLWGALEETLFGCGDPNRPDVVYYSKKGYPESWPAENTISLDAPQDEAVAGLIYDGKSFVFTQEALYQLIPNIIDGLTWTPIKTPCGRGVVAPFAMCVGPKIWFVAKDGVYEWDGQGESRLISDALRPLFPYAGVEGYTVSFGGVSYNPVDFGIGIQPNLQMRLTFHNGEVWFHYRDIFGNAQTAVYNDEHKAWRFVAVNTYVMTYSDEPPQSVMLGVDLSGNTAQFTGGDRAGSPVSSVLMTGGHDQGFPRADKTYGDGAIWMDVAGGSVTLTVYANSDFTTSVHGQVFTGGGLRKYIINLAGLYARHIAYQLSWDSTDSVQPVLYWIENSYLPLPEEITQRTTDWDDLGHPADKMIKGLLITADTRGNAIEINVEADGGTVYANFTIGPNTGGSPQTYNIGFAAFRARQVRIVPISTGEWKFYGINKWLFDAEPESLDCHDVYWGDGGYAHDKLIKGATIEADCQGVARTLNVFDDQGVLRESLVIGPGIAGIPAIYELGFASFRTRNVRIMECSEDAAGNPVEPPTECVGGIPEITDLGPADAQAGSGDFTLTVTGVNFVPDSVVSFNDIEMVTTYVSSTELTAAIPGSAITVVGTYDVLVTNPEPGCGPSEPFPFEVSDEVVITGLLIASDESGWVIANSGAYTNPPAAQFRIQQMGASQLYRIREYYPQYETIAEQSLEGSAVRAIFYRFSPDATKLVVLRQINLSPNPGSMYVAFTYDIGSTLTSAGPFTPSMDIDLLDAPIINTWTLTDPDETVLDIAVDNAGAIYTLRQTDVSDVVQDEMTWTMEQFIDASEGVATRINVFADSRSATMTSQAQFVVSKPCTANPLPGSGPIVVEMNTGEAWWSPTPTSDSAACSAIPLAPFCPGTVINPEFQEADSVAEVTITLEIDRTGLVDDTYTDKTSDHPSTPILDMAGTDFGVTPVACGELTAPANPPLNPDERTMHASMIQTPLLEVRLTVGVPTAARLALWKQPVAGPDAETFAYTFLAGVNGEYAEANSITRILNAESGLIVIRSDRPDLDGAMRVFDLSAGVVTFAQEYGDGLLTVRPAPDTPPEPARIVVPVGTGRNLYIGVGYDSQTTDPDPFNTDITYIIAEVDGEYETIFFTNNIPNLTPEYQFAIGSVAYGTNGPGTLQYVTPLLGITGDRAGFCVGSSGVFDSVVRTLIPGVADNEVTAEGGPFDPTVAGDLTVSPGEADESRVRAIVDEPIDSPPFGIETFSDTSWLINPDAPMDPVYRPSIVAIGVITGA